MRKENQTQVTEFLILGFSNLPHLQLILFNVFLLVYVVTLLGNMMVIIILQLKPVLHTPMYFFLRNLSFLEACFSSVTLPKMLVNLLAEDKTISFRGCATQMFFLLFLGTTECFLLAVMAYDRYVAICYPLRYAILMNQGLCRQLATGCWVSGILLSLGQTSFIFSLPFCGSNILNHFFCDVPPILKLACGNTFFNEVALFAVCVFILLIPFLLTLLSYSGIINTVLHMHSAEGRRKAFSTCASHLTSVTLFYGTASFMYLRPKSSYSLDTDRLLALFYSVVTPMLNPIIYTLRNKEVKGALIKALTKKN
ncbi:olfactory receptor 5V1-like [Rhinatrema bivittatum]|uniref:olfactory receptor 5V1-like n=1 Tax=Rhinatrema bivittatum TaxID=194408 RepID=UPI001127FC36|nr:olfactory receptor 5V1-like [Rhinatrema bivittatum]